MAKKGGIQQLQVELNNDDDFEKYLERYPTQLIVFDVYSEWCGPSIGAINALKKIKLELGGENLQLAICKSDHITKLRRFRKRSEPTWLFVRGGKSTNLMFGSKVPQLIALIKAELNRLHTPLSEISYIEIDELHPEEQRREQIKNERLEAIERKERYEREKKRRDYLLFCTNAILESLPDVGVSVFGPQVNRDMFKKINEPADGLKMSCKDRRFQYVTKEDFEIVNFACRNPLPDDVIEELTKQEILLCFWKISDEAVGNVPYVMSQYANELTKRVVEPPDEYNSEEKVIPPILEPMKVKVQYEVDDNVICPPDEDELAKQAARPSTTPIEGEETVVEVAAEEEDEGEGAVETQPPALEGFDEPGSEQGAEEEEEAIEAMPEEPPPKKICTKTVIMPPIWVPNNERTHAALIYTFFRAQTFPFLPPDPPPEPPCVIMAFDTYKKRDLISIAERNKKDIPYYGFFTSEDADEAKFIANSAQKYQQKSAAPDDKLVFKVNKQTSHMMLSLASFGATYVSPNTIIGKEEAKKFFPESYRTAEQDRLDAQEAQKKEGEGGKEPIPNIEEDEADLAAEDAFEAGEGPDLEEAYEGAEEDGEVEAGEEE